MSATLPQPNDSTPDLTPVQRALDYGVDLSLLRANLRLTPTERVRQLQQRVAAVRALQAEVRRWRDQPLPHA